MKNITMKIRVFFLAVIVIAFTANAFAIGVWPTEIVPHPPHFPTPEPDEITLS